MRLRVLFTTALFLLAVTAVADAAKDDLEVGDSAPGLSIEEWVKGSETTIEDGNIYIIEFWATWCAPCRRSIPHLTEIQEVYGDHGITVIGISDEDVEKVQPFVKSQGKKMDYTVAVDRRGATKREWMDAAGKEGIPTAFIVTREGKVAYIGHPLEDEMLRVLEKVIRGRFDPKLEKVAKPMLEAARRYRKVKSWRMATKRYDEIIALKPSVFAEVALEKFDMMVLDMEDREAAYSYMRDELINGVFAEDVEALKDIAEKLAADPNLKKLDRDLDLALEAARKMRGLSNEKSDFVSLTTLAKVYYHRGEFDDAVKYQRDAWKMARPRYKSELKRVLKSYQDASRRDAVQRVGKDKDKS